MVLGAADCIAATRKAQVVGAAGRIAGEVQTRQDTLRILPGPEQ